MSRLKLTKKEVIVIEEKGDNYPIHTLLSLTATGVSICLPYMLPSVVKGVSDSDLPPKKTALGSFGLLSSLFFFLNRK